MGEMSNMLDQGHGVDNRNEENKIGAREIVRKSDGELIMSFAKNVGKGTTSTLLRQRVLIWS